MMSMSGGWFFVVASEAITVGDTTDHFARHRFLSSRRPIPSGRLGRGASAWRWSTMAVVILAYDQLLFRPVIAWAAKFRVELSAGQEVEKSWVLRYFAAHPLDPPGGRAAGFRACCARSALLRIGFPPAAAGQAVRGAAPRPRR